MTRWLLACALLAFALAATAGGVAAAAKNKKKVKLNMPKGWSWPPSAKMQQQGKACLKDLDRVGLNWRRAKATGKIVTPVVVDDMTFGGLKVTARGKGPHVMDCHLARALARWAGPALTNMHVVELRVGQIHQHRDVAGKPGVLSRHALGLAMDITTFVTDDGVEHTVVHDYTTGDGTLLEAEERLNQSGAFRLLLTPANDPKRHDDHFHLEARVPGDKVVTSQATP